MNPRISELRELIRDFPTQSGVYLMKSSADKILYVGKAKNLRNRVRSYFQDSLDHPKTLVLVRQIHNVEYIVTKTEVEAFLLEASLIKKHRPKYNIRLKDDKSYLFKALYRKKNYLNPIENIEDKIGTRIVVLKSDDIKIVQQRILEANFWVPKLTKNIDQEIEDKPNIFDYQSSHIVVRPLDNDNHFPPELINSLS